jgi:hypothetical protein
MTFTTLKEKLHDYIGHADEKKVKAIYTLVENEIDGSTANYIFDEETVNFLEERRTEYINSGEKGFTADKSIDLVKKEHKKRGF